MHFTLVLNYIFYEEKKNIFILLPALILILLYFQAKKPIIKTKTERKFFTGTNIKLCEAIIIPGIIDGIQIDGDNLWVNQRFSILKYNKSKIKQLIINTNNLAVNSPIINFHISQDSLFYYQGNTSTINFVDLKNKTKNQLYFNFSISYFIKSKGYSFIFQENVIDKNSSQIKYKNYGNGVELINNNVFSLDVGSSMKYSGCFLSNNDESSFLFVPFYDGYIFCLDYQGNLKFKYKSIDFQNEKLEIIKEGDTFFLSPSANILRMCATVYKEDIFLTSNVKSLNQTDVDFNTKPTVDVYSIKNGKYKFSFYLPHYADVSPSDFKITNSGKLYVLYGNTILVYDISQLEKAK